MSRALRLLLLALVVVGLTVPAAQSDGEPGPTKLFIQFYGPGDHAGQEIDVIAHVRPLDGSSAYPKGSVVFSVGDGQPVPIDPYYLTAKVTTTIPSNAPFSVSATFIGTDGWLDSTTTGTFTPLQNLYWDPNPTIARLSGLKITLGFSTYRRNSLGAGIPGRDIAFTLFKPAPNIAEPNKGNVPVCTATTDANGLARCSGLVLVPAVVSLLAGGAWAADVTEDERTVPGLDWVLLPAIKF